MANGNTHIIRKTKYLIVGVADDEFDEKGMRILHAVNYTVPTPGDINKWVNNACDYAVTGIECETILVNGVNLFVITIPSTFDVHETKRELNASSHFNKPTVFMRQDENTVPASFQEGVSIQPLKLLYRREIANLSAVSSGVIIGGIISLVFWTAGRNAYQTTSGLVDILGKTFVVLLGGGIGAEIGWLTQVLNQTRYDWRFFTGRQRIGLIFSLIIIAIALYLWLYFFKLK
jgi:hypothetical protein